MPLPSLTPDELVSTLKNSALPTLVVEGTTDASIYRMIERTLRFPGGTVLPAGSRDTVLAVYKRRTEFAHLRTAFLADRDMWLFTTVPLEYEGVVFTCGYSIENDLLDGGAVDRLCDDAEQIELSVLLAQLARWFAFEVEEWRAGRDPILKVTAARLIPMGTTTLDEQWLRTRNFREPSPATLAEVGATPRMRVRGKQVLDAVVRVLTRPTRKAKHGRENIIEICATSPDHHTCRTLIESLQHALGKTA